jgi:hypothetical protein
MQLSETTMTRILFVPQYRYKWVSTILAGEPDTAAMEKAKRRGWEVVPDDEVPADMKSDNPGLALYRMDENKAKAVGMVGYDTHKKAEAFTAFEWLYHKHPAMGKFHEIRSHKLDDYRKS